MNKRLVPLFSVLVLLALAFSTAAAQDDPLTIWADEARAPIIEEIGAAFTEEYGIPVEVTQLGFGDIRDQLTIAAPAGEGPDIIIGAHDWVGQLAADNLLAPIELSDELRAQFSETALGAFTYNGELLGLPYAVENVALFRNVDLVPEAPATWDDVLAVSQEIIDSEAAQYGFVYQRGDPYHFYGIQTAFGGYVFGTDEEGNWNVDDLGIDSEGTIAAVDFISTAVADGVIPSTNGDEATALFESGDAALIIAGPWFTQRFADAGINYAIDPIPAGPGGPGRPFLGVQGFMVNNLSEQADLAVAFLTEFIATAETQNALQEAGGRPAALTAAAEMAEDPTFPAFAAAGAVGQPMPNVPEMNAVWGAWGNAITLAIQGDAAADAALGEAAQSIRDSIAGVTPEATAEATPGS